MRNANKPVRKKFQVMDSIMFYIVAYIIISTARSVSRLFFKKKSLRYTFLKLMSLRNIKAVSPGNQRPRSIIWAELFYVEREGLY